MKKIFLPLILITLLFTACAPATPVPPSDPSVVDTQCVNPESDNGKSWSTNSCVPISTQVYTLEVTVVDDIVNHTEVNGSGSGYYLGGYGSMSMRIWQDGKGLLPVKIESVSPEVTQFDTTRYAIIKISDLKAMALPNGATTTIICNMDVEVLSPVQNYQVLTTDRMTYEFDDCRMTSPTYWFKTSVTPVQ